MAGNLSPAKSGERRSCFSCKIRGGRSYGKCARKDGLTPILEKVEELDALILGSPIYFGAVTGGMRSFMERLLFPYLKYTAPPRSLFPKMLNTGFIYTMNAPAEEFEGSDFSKHININERVLQMIFGASESLLSFDTYQFDDYSKVVADLFDLEGKIRRRDEVFPQDCQRAFEMGARFAGETI
ncbi:MAG: NAD(P)H-dependent oxidoreductase [Dehalococcoidia bacterium]